MQSTGSESEVLVSNLWRTAELNKISTVPVKNFIRKDYDEEDVYKGLLNPIKHCSASNILLKTRETKMQSSCGVTASESFSTKIQTGSLFLRKSVQCNSSQK